MFIKKSTNNQSCIRFDLEKPNEIEMERKKNAIHNDRQLIRLIN